MNRIGGNRGFTIVELLIVIVVIAILAAITIVAFNGVQGRAHDAAIQNDVKAIGNQILRYEVDNGAYPVGANSAVPVGLGSVKASKGSYDTTVNNLYYCVNSTKFAVAGVSKSGKMWAFHSDLGLREYTGSWSTSTVICPGLGVSGFTFSNGHGTTGGWGSWVQ